MRFSSLPIKQKLMWVIMLTSCTVLLLTAVSLFIYELFTFRQALARTLAARAEVIAASSSAAVAFKNEAEAAEILSSLRVDPQITAAAIYDDKGQLFVSHPASLATNAIPPRPLPHRLYYERGHIMIFHPVHQKDQLHGTLFLQANLGQIYERLRLYGGMTILVMIGSFLVGLGLSNFLQKAVSRPVLNLAQTARVISERQDYSVRAEKTSEDELGTLTDAFNHMLTQIQERDREIRKLNAELEERVLERTAELAASNKELESFTYSVSHDLRAPLRHIDAYAQILQEEFSPDLSPGAEKYLNRIRHGIQTMGRLVDDLLNLARVGRLELNRQTCELKAIVHEVIGELKPEIAGREIEWKIGPLSPVECDPGLVKQVFANLLSNAVKYTRPRPKAIIEIGEIQGDDERVFFVKDNGVGFNMKYAGKLFGVFQRLHRAEDFEGTGVGLAIVERIIVKHGGRVWAEAELDKGAAFYFTLNQAKREHAPGANSTPPAATA